MMHANEKTARSSQLSGMIRDREGDILKKIVRLWLEDFIQYDVEVCCILLARTEKLSV